MTVGERLKCRRRQLGLSAEQVAEKLGISPSTIYRYENGDINKMGIDKLGPIADAVQTTPAFLMGWTSEPSTTSQKDKILPLSDESLKVGTAYDRAQPGVKFSVRKLLDIEEPEQPDLSIVARGGVTVRGKPDHEIDPKEVERLANKIKDPDGF